MIPGRHRPWSCAGARATAGRAFGGDQSAVPGVAPILGARLQATCFHLPRASLSLLAGPRWSSLTVELLIRDHVRETASAGVYLFNAIPASGAPLARDNWGSGPLVESSAGGETVRV